jgi:hypothetical protein
LDDSNFASLQFYFTNKTGHLAFNPTELETRPNNISFHIALPFVPITTRSIFWESINESIESDTFFEGIIA